MKNSILILYISLISIAGFSQTKTGTIDVDFVILQMPEIEGVQKNLQEYGENLDKQLDTKMKEYQAKLNEYNTNVDTYTEDLMREKQTAILGLEAEISNFRQNGIQLMRIREDELKRPLYRIIAEALEVVANEQKFTQIFNTSTDTNLVFLDPDYDITIAVLDKMGIKVEIED